MHSGNYSRLCAGYVRSLHNNDNSNVLRLTVHSIHLYIASILSVVLFSAARILSGVRQLWIVRFVGRGSIGQVLEGNTKLL